jgi:hypothetical protein
LRCDVLKCIVLDIELVGVLVFRSDCKVFGCISSKSEQNWSFVLVFGYVLSFWAGVWH